jgi:hypothetical protein
VARGTTSVVLEDLERVSGIIADADEQTLAWARKLHRKACARSWLRRVWSALSGIDRSLLSLDDLRYSVVLLGWSYIGIQEIAIDRVVGSEGFSLEFDNGFYPLPGHDELRWLETAIGCLDGLRMPVIEMVKVDSMYYAQTGQYQLSVARAQGKKVTTAYVTSWDVQGQVHTFI